MSQSLDSMLRIPAAPTIDLPAPTTLEGTGLSIDLVTPLVLKTLHFCGELTGWELARRLGVVFGVLEPSLELLKAQRYCEISGGALVGGTSFRYRITHDGRAAAGQHLQQNQYVGPMPVPLAQYRRYLEARRDTLQSKVTPDQVRACFAHLVLSDRVLDEIGPALSGGRAMFIYGAPGNGKSAIAGGLRHLLGGSVAVPHALEVQGCIVRVFDPGLHEPLAETDEGGLAIGLETDRRWVTCRRPCVIAGGELTLESLELAYDERLGYYRAPLQLVANGGVLIIDDFGRERCAPRDLLNRWMVPLESSVDFLTLRSGLKFEVPFLIFVAFATNVTPSELVDEAFLRRVHYKILAESPSADDFRRIFENYCHACEIAFEPALVDRLIDGYYQRHQVPLRGCHPRDLIDQALRLADYRDAPRELTDELLETACSSYFVQERR